MIALLQRVNSSSVSVDNQKICSISKGALVFLGVEAEDDRTDCEYLAKKIANIRMFGDSKGKMNLSAQDVSAQILLVSQFTLTADTKKGLRPSFSKAAEPKKAEELYEYAGALLKDKGLDVKTGIFAAHMIVSLENNGPVTLILNSKK
ncbi:MAG: D-tyrosyl-tRNA(Tyr) deacylase [Candidatus Omnitrophica bacterium]|nr:D-tyrosyl-tRNA(Tyr) deacylase [Candidatus Omnitrophota bacterium]